MKRFSEKRVCSFHVSATCIQRGPRQFGGLIAGLLILRSRVRAPLNRKPGSIAHSLSFSPFHRPNITEILLKKTKNRKSSIHPLQSKDPIQVLNYGAFCCKKHTKGKKEVLVLLPLFTRAAGLKAQYSTTEPTSLLPDAVVRDWI